MKILIGAMLILLVGLGLTGWQLRESLKREGVAAQELAGVQGALATAKETNAQLADRFDVLDNTLKGLGASQSQNQAELKTRLANLTTIVKETGDTDESISCLDQRLPAQLDRGLREPTPAGH